MEAPATPAATMGDEISSPRQQQPKPQRNCNVPTHVRAGTLAPSRGLTAKAEGAIAASTVTAPLSSSFPTCESAVEGPANQIEAPSLPDVATGKRVPLFLDDHDDEIRGGDQLLTAAAIEALCLAPPDQLITAAAKGPSGDLGKAGAFVLGARSTLAVLLLDPRLYHLLEGRGCLPLPTAAPRQGRRRCCAFMPAIMSSSRPGAVEPWRSRSAPPLGAGDSTGCCIFSASGAMCGRICGG